jgi:hypothetical protein
MNKKKRESAREECEEMPQHTTCHISNKTPLSLSLTPIECFIPKNKYRERKKEFGMQI